MGKEYVTFVEENLDKLRESITDEIFTLQLFEVRTRHAVLATRHPTRPLPRAPRSNASAACAAAVARCRS